MQVKKTRVRFAKLVRLIKDVEITLPADFESYAEEEQQEILSEFYEEQNDYDFGWEIDYEWGEDEGTHEILSKKENQDEDQDDE